MAVSAAFVASGNFAVYTWFYVRSAAKDGTKTSDADRNVRDYGERWAWVTVLVNTKWREDMARAYLREWIAIFTGKLPCCEKTDANRPETLLEKRFIADTMWKSSGSGESRADAAGRGASPPLRAIQIYGGSRRSSSFHQHLLSKRFRPTADLTSYGIQNQQLKHPSRRPSPAPKQT